VTLLLLATGAPARLPGLTVTEVWKQHDALDGQVVRVSGVVTRCAVLSCSLRENPSPSARGLGIGPSQRFDADIQSRLGQPVVIEGVFDAACLHARADRASGNRQARDIVVCTDRAPELRDPRLVSLR
jgi:hypothetical protein